MAMEPPEQIRIGGARKREKEPYTETRTARVDLSLSVNTRPDLFCQSLQVSAFQGPKPNPKHGRQNGSPSHPRNKPARPFLISLDTIWGESSQGSGNDAAASIVATFSLRQSAW